MSGMAWHFYYSRWRVYVWLAITVPFGLYLLVVCWALQAVIGPLSWLVGVPCLLLLIFMIWHWSRRLRDRGPVLTLDAVGILDRRQEPQRRVPWVSIRKLYIASYGGGRGLLVAFVSDQAGESALGRPLGWGGRSLKLHHLIDAPGAKWGIELGPLSCSVSQLFALAQKLHQQAWKAAAEPARPAASAVPKAAPEASPRLRPSETRPGRPTNGPRDR